MSGKGKLKSVKGGKNKRLANCKSFFIWLYVASLFFVCIADKYLTVSVYASEGETNIDYYTPDQVGQIKIGDMVVSLQNASGFTITDQKYINAIKNNMNGDDQDIAHIMEMSEADAVQYLNVCINNAQSAGATKLQNSLSISSEMADYLNEQEENYNVVPQNGGELLYETIKETYNNNQNSDSDKATFWASLKNNYGSHGPGNVAMSRGLAKATITGLAGTMFGVPGAVIAGLKTGIFGINVQKGAGIRSSESYLNSIPDGYHVCTIYEYETNSNIATYFVPDGALPVMYHLNDVTEWQGYIYKVNATQPAKQRTYDGQIWNLSFGGYPYPYCDAGRYDIDWKPEVGTTGFIYFNNQNELYAYLDSILGGDRNLPSVVSPDIVGNQGNLNFDNDNQSININQVYDPSDNYFLPIKIGSDSYGDYINTLNKNTTNNYGQNGNVYNNYITNNYITNAPPAPTPTPTPIVPDQPTVPDIPSIEDISPEEAQELIDNMLPDLRNFFPFCIPFDVLAIAQAFSSDNREAPVFDWDLPLGVYGTQHIHLDLSQWDDIAALLRALELALFILGLMQFARAVDTKD